MKILLLPAFLAASLSAAADPIVWAKNIDEAKKAGGEKKPIAVLLTQKGCALSAEFVKNLMKDDRLPDLAPGFSWLSIQVGTKEYDDWFVKTCGGNVEGTPSLVFLNPKGENADPDYAGLATVSSPDPDDVIPVLREVLQRGKQAEPEKDKTAVKAALDKAKAASVPAESVAALRAAIRAGDGWRTEAESVAKAREGIEKILQDGSAEIIRILQKVHDSEEAKKALEKVRTDYAGTALVDWATDELIRLKTAKK